MVGKLERYERQKTLSSSERHSSQHSVCPNISGGGGSFSPERGLKEGGETRRFRVCVFFSLWVFCPGI